MGMRNKGKDVIAVKAAIYGAIFHPKLSNFHFDFFATDLHGLSLMDIYFFFFISPCLSVFVRG
jgi:hypothetical protein